MTESDFKKLIGEFCKRFPDTGKWLRGLSDDTLEYWFQEYFQQFELRDATAALDAVMADVSTAFAKRERIPAIMMKHMQDVRWNREERLRTRQRDRIAAERGEQHPVGKTFKGSDRECYDALLVFQDNYRHEHRVNLTPTEVRRQFIDAWFDKNVPEDDPHDQPRFRCRHCQDAGWMSFKKNAFRFMGYCPHCDKGAACKDNWNDNRRCQLGSGNGKPANYVASFDNFNEESSDV